MHGAADADDICAQIGLVDLLREEYGITPGGVLGHSAGEIACGYGDGCFTREQCVLVAYHRGRMCPEHGISGGLMAAVGLGVEEAEARLTKHGQPGCVVGCDNSPNSVTLSGAAYICSLSRSCQYAMGNLPWQGNSQVTL